MVKKRIILYVISIMQFYCAFAQDAISDYELQADKSYSQADMLQAAELYNKAAYNYWNKGSLRQAISCFSKVLEINNKLNNQNAISIVQNNLGLLYSDMEDYPNALESFMKAYTFIKNGKDKREYVSSLQNIATTLQYLNRYDESVKYLSDAIKSCEELNDLNLIRKTYGLIAESYEHMNQSSKAFEYYEKFSMIDKKIKQMEMNQVQITASNQVNKANEDKKKTEIELDKTTDVLKQTADSLELTERLAHEQQMELELRGSQIREKESQIKYERSVRYSLTIAVSGILVVLVLLAFFLRQKQKDNQLLKLKNTEIENQKTEITHQKEKLDRQHTNITASISYAQTIQQAILPEKITMEQYFESFILYKPKDIVSGDFYFFTPVAGTGRFYVAVCDCTGHGVPGAFMSLIGSRLLNELIIRKNIESPSVILQNLNAELRKALKQETTENNDGMDVSLCAVDRMEDNTVKITFAGAKRPLLIYRETNKLIETIDGDSVSIGGRSSKKDIVEFTNHEILMKKGDVIFLSSDGIIDQNGPDRKRFGTPKLTSVLLRNIEQPLDEQERSLMEEFRKHLGSEEQRDDITLWGIKL